jgi:hypothetical protein
MLPGCNKQSEKRRKKWSEARSDVFSRWFF